MLESLDGQITKPDVNVSLNQQRIATPTFTASSSMIGPQLVGVAGGSGSGKSYFANALLNRLGSDLCAIIHQDNFYIDQSERFDFDGGSVNFDHPSSIDFVLLAETLARLKRGESVDVPIYDFVTHRRKAESVRVSAKPVIIVDGILIFHSEIVRAHLNERIFFETPEHVRYQRRLERDVKERGRTAEGVRAQFLKQVKPMHDEFVQPSITHALAVVRDVSEFNGILSRVGERFSGL